MLKREKERVVADLVERLRASDTLMTVADYRGLTMPEIDSVRTEVLKHGSPLPRSVQEHAHEACGRGGRRARAGRAPRRPDRDRLRRRRRQVGVAKALNDTARRTKILRACAAASCKASR